MTPRSLLAIVAGAVTALALWPVLGAHRAPAAAVTPAPLVRDYETRDRLIAFYERQVRENPRDQIQMRMLAAQYLQRFREQSDLTDVDRAQKLAERAIELQPQGNTAGQMTLASALLTYHHFRRALVHERDAWRGEPTNANALAQIASLQMELGNYTAAKATLDRIRRGPAENPTVDSIRARYDELTGNLDEARQLIASATRSIDSDISIPAYDRSWFHMRAGQLAFEAGDFDTAQAEYRTALDDDPKNAMALMWQARLYRAQRRWSDALAAASASANLYPLPQALGYEADAQRALGERDAAAQTDALIGAEQRLFDTQGINDRLLANYYAQRGEHLDAALRAAQSDYAKRGDEIYADDTLGWVLARMGRWNEAKIYTERAVRLRTQDAELQYHAAIVELHTGDAARGKTRLESALRENPSFDPFEADDARAQLAKIE